MVGGGALPLFPVLANRSAAPPGAAAARCLRTDYDAFRGSLNIETGAEMLAH